jgi:hypothetical protein
MNLNGNKSRLTGLTKELTLRWADTKEHWRDAKGAEFERQFMRDLFPQVNGATAAIEQLDELFKRIRHDCE